MSEPARVQIAPMLAVTDRHFRRFMRGITHRAELWTEMQVESTLSHTDNLADFLDFHPSEHPIVCQLGGCHPYSMARAAASVASWGYDEVNINVGCPSAKVAGKGCFGASLMKSPEAVADVVRQIRREVPDLNVSVKTRVGVDEWDSQAFLNDFISTVSAAGCHRFIIHARKAWLKGLNPTMNRTIPPLQYEKVYQLIKAFPHLQFSANGGVNTLDEVDELLHARWRPEVILTPRKKRRPEVSQPSDDDVDSICEKLAGTVLTESDDPSDRKKRQERNQEEKEEERRQERKEEKEDERRQERKEESHVFPLGFSEDIEFGEVQSRRRRLSKQPIITQRELTPIPVREEKVSLEEVLELMNSAESEKPVMEGVMIGRAALNNPCVLASVDSRFYGTPDPYTARTPRSIVQNYVDYLDEAFPEPRLEKSCFPLVKPILGLLTGRPGSKQYRFKLDETVRLEARKKCPGDVVRSVLDFIDEGFPGSLDGVTTAQF